ncbi:MAG TPA: DUF983 domain-containing protein, partial [Longimicrobiaceae bacterium]|nr:DUF983 domain-containing protein [Longimicrobiaceae bacterium]
PSVPLPPFRTRLARALRLRCPLCGGGPLLQGWLRLRPRCPRCGLHSERGQGDFFLGAMMFNLAISEGTLALLLTGLVAATWPEVPWRSLEIGGVALMVLAPFIFFPFARTTWMAFDLMLHPPTAAELAGAGGGDRAEAEGDPGPAGRS